MSATNTQAQQAIDACNAQNAQNKADSDKYDASYKFYTDAAGAGQKLVDVLNNAAYGVNYNSTRPTYRDVPGYTTTKAGNKYYIYNDSGYMNRSRYDPGGLSKCKTMSMNIDPNTNGYVADGCIQTMQTLTPGSSADPNPLQRGDVEWSDVAIGGAKCDGSRDVTAYCKKTSDRIAFENTRLAAAQKTIDDNRIAATTLPHPVNNSKCSICASNNVLIAGAGTNTSNVSQSNTCAIPTAAELEQHQADLDKCVNSGGTYDAQTFLCTATKPLLPAPSSTANTSSATPITNNSVSSTPATTPQQPQQPATVASTDNTLLYAGIVVAAVIFVAAIIIIIKKRNEDE
jgi:hypothetical protein